MNYAVILPTLRVGPNPVDEQDFEELKELGITAILSLQSAEDVAPGRDRARAASLGLVHRNIAILDFDCEDLQKKLPRCVEILDELLKAGHSVYMHCTAGVSRSPTVAAAYLHWSLDMPLERALEHVCASRNCSPNRDAILKSERAANITGRQR